MSANFEPCDPHPILWGRCPVCGMTIASTRQMPQGACFSGGAAYAHHVPRSAYTGQPDDSRACMRCGDDVEVGDDEPTRPCGALVTLHPATEHVDDHGAKRITAGIDWPPPTLEPMRTLKVGGETWVVKS